MSAQKMVTWNFEQGSAEWHAHRERYFNASDAPAMLNCKGAHSTRDQLLRIYKYRNPTEVSAYLQRRFDDGHRFEALARPLAEEFLGDLYPLVATRGKLGASLDGVTFDYDDCWEHKTLNDEIRDAFAQSKALFRGLPSVKLPEKYRAQMQQQMIVCGAKIALFSASKWSDQNELIEALHCFYEYDFELEWRIINGWEQFQLDLDAMPEHDEYVPQLPVIGRAPDALPVLRIEVAGGLTLTENNLVEYRDKVREILAAANTKPVTDQDFADADKRVKFASKSEADLKAAEQMVLNKSGSLAEIVALLRSVGGEFREFRLAQEKFLTAQRAAVRSGLVRDGLEEANTYHFESFAKAHIIWPLRGTFLAPDFNADFNAAIKGKSSIDSMRSAISAEVANIKIEARKTAALFEANIMTANKLGRHDLWPDLRTLICKPYDDFEAVLKVRIADADAKEKARIDAEVQRGIELAKQKADAEAKVEKERIEAAEQLAREEAEAESQLAIAQQSVAKILPVALAEFACAQIDQLPPSVVTIESPPKPPSDAPTVNIGQISERLGFTLTRAFLKELGFNGVTVGNYHKFLESDFVAICTALERHIFTIKGNALRGFGRVV